MLIIRICIQIFSRVSVSATVSYNSEYIWLSFKVLPSILYSLKRKGKIMDLLCCWVEYLIILFSFFQFTFVFFFKFLKFCILIRLARTRSRRFISMPNFSLNVGTTLGLPTICTSTGPCAQTVKGGWVHYGEKWRLRYWCRIGILLLKNLIN